MSGPLRIGLLGASRIAPGAVIAPAKARDDVEIVAVAARDPSRAAAYAAEHGIAGVATDYAELVARPDVDVVYNALPPAGHEEWTLAALAAGKAVLCEKPFARNAAEARAMVEAAERAGRPLLEAFHYRLHRVMRDAVEIVRGGTLGPLVCASAQFDAPIKRTPTELRWRADQGGGGLMDLGCYPLHALRSLIGTDPAVTGARAKFEDGVDYDLTAELEFPGGVAASVSCCMTPPSFAAQLSVEGERGRLDIVNFLAPQMGCRFTTLIDGVEQRHDTDGPSTYAAQMQHLVDVMAGRTEPLVGGADAIGNMAAIDAIYAAAGRPAA